MTFFPCRSQLRSAAVPGISGDFVCAAEAGQIKSVVDDPDSSVVHSRTLRGRITNCRLI